MRLRTRIITSVLALALGMGTSLGIGAAMPDATPVVAVNVAAAEETPDTPEGQYNGALADALLTAGYVGDPTDGCACIYVPVGASVDVPGYGPFVVHS